MPDISEIWGDALPKVKQGVTGMGVWAALNACKPVALEDGVFVLGMPYEESELTGHLRIPMTARLIEETVSKIVGTEVSVRVIEGTSDEEWERAKKRDQEALRLQAKAMEKERSQLEARSSWEGVYEQLGRRFAALSNKSLPQTRAKFLKDAVAMLADVRKSSGGSDEYGERNFARCIERVSQFTEVPSGIIAHMVLEASGEK